MNTDQTDPRPDGHAAEPLALRLNDLLGPLPERVASAGCPPPGWVEPGVVPSPVGRLYTQAELEAAVAAERERCAERAGEYAQAWWSKHCASNKHMETTRAAHEDFCRLQADIRMA